MDCLIIYYKYLVFKNFKVSKSQNYKFQIKDSKIPKVSRFQDAKMPRFQDSKILRFQDSKISKCKLHDFKLSQIPNYTFSQTLSFRVAIKTVEASKF